MTRRYATGLMLAFLIGGFVLWEGTGVAGQMGPEMMERGGKQMRGQMEQASRILSQMSNLLRGQ